MFMNWIRRQRRLIDRELRTVSDRRYLTPIFHAHYDVVLPVLKQHIRGKVIDLGCGFLPFKSALIEQVSLYHGLDMDIHDPTVTLVGDIQNLAMLPDNEYDSALCIEVLEHVPNPCAALAEIGRILRPGGVLVLTVPHLSRLHDIPHDYYRYTEYGLRHLLVSAGFTVVMLQSKGGLFTFLGHQISTLLLTLFWSAPYLGQFVRWANRWLIVITSINLDRWLDQSHTFAQGYVAVARKPLENGANAKRAAAKGERQSAGGNSP